MFLCDLADERIEDAQAGVGRDRRLDRRRRRRRALELPRPHQRHRRGDRGGARPRRPAVPDPRHRPVRGGRRRARRSARRSSSRRCPATARRRPTLPAGHVRRRRRQQRRRASPSCSAELGVQVVVSGGQTLNPSTAELLAAVERVNAEQVVVLPGNKNIIPVAEQLDALTDQDGARRAHPVDARGPRRADGLRPRGRRADQHAGRCARPPRRSRPARSPRRSGRATTDGRPGGRGRLDGHRRAATASSPSPPTSLGGAHGAARAPRRRRPRAGDRLTGADADAGDDGGDRGVAGRRTVPDVEVEVHDGGQPLYPYLFGVE